MSHTPRAHDDTVVVKEFHEVVNMSSSALKKWLDTDDSRRVGQKAAGSDESIGHRSGERILKILEKSKDGLKADDYTHMQKVVSYVRRHMAQGPTVKNVADSDWRFSLMNWGHDPLKK
ncbi:MAG: DUF3140 domain-containing protein [Pseudomonadota bacterium]